MVLYILSWIILSVLVGVIGIKRKIGFLGAFLFSIILSPVIGIIVTAFSKDKGEEEYKKETLKTQKQQHKVLEELLTDKRKEKDNDTRVLKEKSIELEKLLNKQKEKLHYLESGSSKSPLSEEDINNKKKIIIGEISKLENKLIHISVSTELSEEINELDKLLAMEIIDNEEYSNRKESLIQNRMHANKFKIKNSEKIDSFKYGGKIEKNSIEFADGIDGFIYTNSKKNNQAFFISINQNGIESTKYYTDLDTCAKAFRIYKETGKISKNGFIKSI